MTKSQLKNLRLYVVDLENTNDLYTIEKNINKSKSDLLISMTNQLYNKDSIIYLQKNNILEVSAWGKEQELQKIEYENKIKQLPY